MFNRLDFVELNLIDVQMQTLSVSCLHKSVPIASVAMDSKVMHDAIGFDTNVRKLLKRVKDGNPGPGASPF